MTRPVASHRWVGAVLLCVLVLVGCGGGEPDGPGTPAGSSGVPTGTSDAPTTASPSAPPEPVRRDRIRPQPADARNDRPELYADGCQVKPDDDALTGCSYGASAEDATATIAVVGDSKAGQWSSALQRLAETRGWRVLIYTKSGCAVVAVPMSMSGEEYESCTRYGRSVIDALVADPADLVFVSNSSDTAYVADRLTPGDDPNEVALDAFVEGEKEAWSAWIEAGSQVAVIGDQPRPISGGYDFDLPTCVERYRDYLERCSFDRAEGLARSGHAGQLRAVEEMGAVDLTPALLGDEVPDASDAPLAWIDSVAASCPDETCLPTDGDVLVYREGSHLTDTYVLSLTDRIGAVMTALGMP